MGREREGWRVSERGEREGKGEGAHRGERREQTRANPCKSTLDWTPPKGRNTLLHPEREKGRRGR